MGPGSPESPRKPWGPGAPVSPGTPCAPASPAVTKQVFSHLYWQTQHEYEMPAEPESFVHAVLKFLCLFLFVQMVLPFGPMGPGGPASPGAPTSPDEPEEQKQNN